MPTKQLMIECRQCEKPTQHNQYAPIHILHLLLTLVTGGLWLFVWIYQISIKPQCTVCGTKAPLSNPRMILIAFLLAAILISITAMAGVITIVDLAGYFQQGDD